MTHPVQNCTREVLDQADRLLRDLPLAAYTATPPAGGSSIGQHMRHMLDHFQVLMQADTELVDYDQRHRGSSIETDIDEARALIARIQAWLSALDADAINAEITVRSEISLCKTLCAEVGSSLGRELMFVASHMVHHQAIVAMLAKSMAVEVEPGLGLAPATRSYLRAVG